ncbi:MAG TPA: RagB/SusD family nutrient uptake outer membrane protein [Longimicrobium sp.]|nr:RagB/SusD family nutrient uptake outer membrane protein [Longimicrobium sp.]
MLAEAVNELSGPTSEAYDAVDAVRARANLSPLLRTLSQQLLREAIQVERRYELVLEGHSYFDMQRHWEWSKARAEQHIQWGKTAAQGGQGLNNTPWGSSVPKVGISAGIIEDKYRFFPIPSAAIATNPQLQQPAPWQAS